MLLPNSIPEAVEGDEIWGIGHINPETFVVMNCTEDRLEDWENIDPILNRLLGYGATQEEIMVKVHCGEDGFEGIVRFLQWFTQKQGLEAQQYQGKLERLSDAMIQLYMH